MEGKGYRFLQKPARCRRIPEESTPSHIPPGRATSAVQDYPDESSCSSQQQLQLHGIMGAQNTKVDSHPVVPGQGSTSLSPEDVATLKRTFNSLHTSHVVLSGKGEKTSATPYGDFQRLCEDTLDDWLARRVTDKLAVKTSKGEELVVPVGKFLSFVGSLLKGSVEEKLGTIWNLAITDVTAEVITAQEITQYTRSIIESYLKSTEGTSCYKSWRGLVPLSSDAISDFAEFLLSDLLHPGVGPNELIHRDKPSKTSFNLEEVTKHFGNSALLLGLHNSIIAQCFKFHVDSNFLRLLPVCHHAQSAFLPEDYTLLDLSKVLFLNSHLPRELRDTWRFLFSTPAHGESFSKLMGLVVDKGPTVLIVREAAGRAGRVFGAFATHSWTLGPKFFGTGNSFLFHLEPKCLIYSSTGYNENFQYLNLGQQTFPNGLGIGGKLEYFGLWLDSEFGKAKASPSCTTYAMPQLATTEEFLVGHVEVWGVGPEPKKDEDAQGERSILDKDPEAKAMLELIDRGRHSDGYREEPQD